MIYSKLVIIDKDDSGYFERIKNKSKAMEGVRALKKIYELAISTDAKNMCSKIATELRAVY
jgi:hypothetical protein